MVAPRHTPLFWLRGLGLPAIVAAKGVTEIADGTVVYVESNEGIVDTEPTDADREAAIKYANRKPVADFDGQGVLADGTRVPLYANVGDGKSAEKAASLRLRVLACSAPSSASWATTLSLPSRLRLRPTSPCLTHSPASTLWFVPWTLALTSPCRS